MRLRFHEDLYPSLLTNSQALIDHNILSVPVRAIKDQYVGFVDALDMVNFFLEFTKKESFTEKTDFSVFLKETDKIQKVTCGQVAGLRKR
jgi:hypothetical protein